MITALLLGLVMFVVTSCVLAIPLAALVTIATGKHAYKLTRPSYAGNAIVLQIMGLLVAVAHLANIGLWAVLLGVCGEFDSYDLAYYHSAVNYTSLGYGDLVMSPRWRLLGPLETLDGIVKLGITTAVMFALLTRLIQRRVKAKEPEHEPAS